MSFIRISLSTQELSLFDEAGYLIKKYPISSGVNGPGNTKGSGCTPTGKHIVRAMIGSSALIGSVFVGRRATGEIFSDELAAANPDRDWILSRIMWLSGTEVGHNRLGHVDTMARYIYIHGTPDIEPMGVPASHGCIRMRNKDIIDLYARVSPGAQVDIG